MMVDEDVLKLVLQDFPDRERGRLAAVVFDILTGLESGKDFEALDPNLVPKTGGYAFLWEDVIGLSDAAQLLAQSPELFALDPAALGKLAVRLAVKWGKLRQLREPLNEEEFRVLHAVRQGSTTASDIATVTGLELSQVETLCNELMSRKYGNDLPLLEVQKDLYVTAF